MSSISWVASVILMSGLVVYAISLFAAFVLNVSQLAAFKKVISENLGRNVGLPASAVGAFCIVIIFWELFPPQQLEQGVSLELFGLAFTGPTGPVTLWIACYLAFVLSIKSLTRK